MEGIGSALFYTSTLAVVPLLFPDHVATLMVSIGFNLLSLMKLNTAVCAYVYVLHVLDVLHKVHVHVHVLVCIVACCNK